MLLIHNQQARRTGNSPANINQYVRVSPCDTTTTAAATTAADATTTTAAAATTTAAAGMETDAFNC